jgi:predicted kinase
MASERLVVRIAERLAAFHAQAASGPGVDDYGSIDTILDNWTQNFAQTEAFIGRILSPTGRDDILRYLEGFLATEQPRLEARVRNGRIRDGHGDLHAGSVCVAGRRLYLFDCVEFDARFRCADVAAEVACLAMDLDHFGHADLGRTFVDAYVRASKDRELRAVLDFYKCYRAFVRGKVLSLRLNETGLDEATSRQIAAESSAYFNLAHTYTRPSPPRVLVVMMGLPASGKSTLARALAGRLAMVHLSSDVVRKRMAGLNPTSHGGDQFGRGLYTSTMTRRTYNALRRKAARSLRRGQSVVLDATYGQRRERAEIRHLARRTGARLVVFECHAGDDVLLARLAAREGDAETTSDARLDLWPALRGAYTEPSEVTCAMRVDTSRPVDEVVHELVALVRDPAHASALAA